MRGAARTTRRTCMQGRVAESTAILQDMADGNRTRMPGRPLMAPTAPSGVGSTGGQATLLDTFRVPELRRRQLVMMTAWAVVSMAYYGVSLGLDELGGSLFLNFFLAALIEFPAYFSVMMVRCAARAQPVSCVC